MGLFYLANKAKQFRHLGEKSFEETFNSNDLFSRLGHVLERCFRFELNSSTQAVEISGRVTFVNFGGKVIAAVGNKPIAVADEESCSELVEFFGSVPELCGEVPAEIMEFESLTNSFQAKVLRPGKDK